MKTANLKVLALATGALGSLMLPGAVQADPAELYIGGGVSASRLHNAEVDDNDVGTGDLEDFDDDRVAWQAYLGAMITPHLGVEVGYLDLGKHSDSGFDIEGDGVTAAGLLAFPLSDRFSLYAKGGRVWWDIDADGPLGFEASTDDEDWFYGAGLRMDLVDHLAVRFEYTRFELDGSDVKADLDLATVGVQYLF